MNEKITIMERMNNIPNNQKFPLYVDGTTQCALFAKKVIIDQMEATLKLKKPTNKEFMLQLNFHRIHALLFTMQFLRTDVIHCQTLAQCARTIFELGLDIEYAEKIGTSDIYDKFFAHATVVTRYSRAEKYVENNPNATSDYHHKISSNFINNPANKRNYDKLSKRYYLNSKGNKVIIPDNWSGLKISERAVKVGKPYSDIYKRNYAYLSDNTHSSGTIFINTPVEIFTYICVSSHILAQNIFDRITKIVAKTFYIDKTFTNFNLKLAEVSGYTTLKLKELAESL